MGIVCADSKGMLHDRVTALRRANSYERQSYRHLIELPAILGELDGAVRAETPFLVVEDGVLRFRERLVVCDSSRVDTLLAIPL